MSQSTGKQPWTEAEKQSLRDLARYAAYIMSAIVVALIAAAVLASVFNLEAGAGTATSSDPAGTPAATQPPS